MSKEAYRDFGLACLPKWFRDTERAKEVANAFAEIYYRVEQQMDHWHDMTFILTAINEPPDWLNQHAIDRNSYRQPSESDTALRQRLRTFEDALTPPVILQAIQDLLDAEGIVGSPAMVELPKNIARSYVHTEQSGVGGVFTTVDTDMVFTPDAGISGTLALSTTPTRGNWQDTKLVISGSVSAGNDGTFDIIGFEGDGIRYTNGSGVAETSGTSTWTTQKRNKDDQNLVGNRRAFFDRGYRIGAVLPVLIIILPFGCTAGTLESVAELLRQRSGAGVRTVSECRAIP